MNTALFTIPDARQYNNGRNSLRKGAVPTRFLTKGYLIAHATRRSMRGNDYADIAGAVDDTLAAIKALKK